MIDHLVVILLLSLTHEHSFLCDEFVTMLSHPHTQYFNPPLCQPHFSYLYSAYEELDVSDDGRLLKISNAQLSDRGRYVCKAENIAGEAEKIFDLAVLSK